MAKGKHIRTEKTLEKMRENAIKQFSSLSSRKASSERMKLLWQNDGFREKVLSARKGTQVGEKHPMYGKHHTIETKNKISNKISRIVKDRWSKGFKGSTGYRHTDEAKKKITDSLIGHKRQTKEVREKMSKALLGEKCWNWKGGITPERTKIWRSIEYKNWRKSVFERDQYTCQICGQIGGELQADHIKPFAYFKDLRFDLANGRTLCVPCHRMTPTYGMNGRKIYANS